MHHFEDLVPNYESIASSTQLGPNIFWSLSVLRYAGITGNITWLLGMQPYLDLSTDYITQLIDPEMGLLNVPGPLWIDVLVRENYTSDSNAAALLLFQQLADMYDVLDTVSNATVTRTSTSTSTNSDAGTNTESNSDSDNNNRSKVLRELRSGIIKGMNEHLWDNEEDDHYITQLNPDGTTRDFVDYDSNLLAVAFGALDLGDDRIDKILTRVDSGEHTHVRATWCSEIAYSGDAEDCYIVGGDVCGDSIVTGRIGWADSHARKLVGDVDTFINKLLEPLQEDLLDDIWLYERYDENATQIRTAYYFEYPSLVVMMLRELVYGIDLQVGAVTIDPFPRLATGTSYLYAFGSVRVYYSESLVTINIPGEGELSMNIDYDRKVDIYGMLADTVYTVTNTCEPDAKLVKQIQQAHLHSKVFSLRQDLSKRTPVPSVVSEVQISSSGDGLVSFSMNSKYISNSCTIRVEAKETGV